MMDDTHFDCEHIELRYSLSSLDFRRFRPLMYNEMHNVPYIIAI